MFVIPLHCILMSVILNKKEKNKEAKHCFTLAKFLLV